MRILLERVFLKNSAIVQQQASSSIGRAPVSKTGGWGFDSLLACQNLNENRALIFQAPDLKVGRYNMGISNFSEKTSKFVKEVHVEMQKVTWPSKEEVWNATTVVIVATIIVSIYIWGLDWVFGKMYLLGVDTWNVLFSSK